MCLFRGVDTLPRPRICGDAHQARIGILQTQALQEAEARAASGASAAEEARAALRRQLGHEDTLRGQVAASFEEWWYIGELVMTSSRGVYGVCYCS